ncbi:CPBP family intramembrane glutamic endopeptidase [Lactobacillus helsingborgensis]|uniref:CPBP family intramembrane glutamic endopeptidase n=1 Tax=Lactobacillus helsingborgensis TaxID=1218494 RepID=UPI001CC5F117|nr:type II CAAX endopeptidase family protein [Lactobacillus helsingborgensis]
MNTKNSVSNKVIVIYLVIFYIWWTIEELAYWSYTSNTLAQVLLSSSVKLLTWSIPAFILIKKYSHQLKIGYPQLFKNRFKLWPYLVGIFIMVTYLAIILYFENGGFKINPNFRASDFIDKFLVVGITEELVFRGCLLNALLKKMSTWLALIVNNLLFLCIHLPIWYQTHTLVTNFISGDFISVFILGLIFGLLFIRSKNICVPIVYHMLWDIIVTIF